MSPPGDLTPRRRCVRSPRPGPSRVRFFGGGTPKAPRPSPPPPEGPTTAELEAAAKARMLARNRRGRRSTILTGPQGDPAMLMPESPKPSLLGGTMAPTGGGPTDGAPSSLYG